jgi:YidC/Oxa1 family membrane protein insertase
MERSGALRWLLIGLVVFLGITFLPKFFGGDGAKPQPLQPEGKIAPKARKPEALCDIWGPRFRAQVGSKSATLKHFDLTTAKYRHDGKPIDLSTTPDVEERRQLLFHFRNDAVSPGDGWQVPYDLFDFQLTKADGKSCEFVYKDDNVEVIREVRATERPYELLATAKLKNLSKKKLRHALTVDTTAWRLETEVHGGMFRVSPFMSFVECVSLDNDTVRLQPTDFESKSFEDKAFSRGPLNQGDWHQVDAAPAYAAVSNAYFSHAIVPMVAPASTKPICQLQVEDRWDSSHFKDKGSDPNGGSMYRARLAYVPVDLAPGETAEYQVLEYAGPKEREILAAVGGGKADLSQLIDLGFFSVIAKVLVAFLLKVHSVLPNWGIAIILLTLTARVLLFPLAVPSIRSMVKMRELKPELDAITDKYKDDPQAKGLAQMELWRKHNINPLKGCLPQLASMPVWFALYTTLQTAVELYNIPFLWFPDLSQPDKFYILPFIIGATSYFQQKLLPMQGDPAQQKMMLYFMPAMFTVFMLFLPAGLGVYMFSNGVLTIVQQQIVERHVKRQTAKESEKKTAMTADDEANRESSAPKKKGKSSDGSDLDGRPLLGKGKA